MDASVTVATTVTERTIDEIVDHLCRTAADRAAAEWLTPSADTRMQRRRLRTPPSLAISPPEQIARCERPWQGLGPWVGRGGAGVADIAQPTRRRPHRATRRPGWQTADTVAA
jgi:hypothetical protein